jgi:hypothetical protein
VHGRDVASNLEEVGRFIYSNDNITINLAAAILGVVGLFLCE